LSVNQGDLFALYSWDEVEKEMQPQHIMLRVGDWYLDGNGVSNFDRLVTHWQTIEQLEVGEVAPISLGEALAQFCGVYQAEVLEQISDMLSQTISRDWIAWAKGQHQASEWYLIEQSAVRL
jgi:hypothetical protein